LKDRGRRNRAGLGLNVCEVLGVKTSGFIFEGFKKSPRRVGIQTLTAFVVLIGEMAKRVGCAERDG
jgi:hypothetical protein